MCSKYVEMLTSIPLSKFKSQVISLNSFVTDAQWITMLKFDMALNPDLAYDLTNYISQIDLENLNKGNCDKIIKQVRNKCTEYISKASLENDPVKRWYLCRRAYAYYGFIETITEGSIITDKILNKFKDKYGEGYLERLKKLDNINPSVLTNFGKSDDTITLDPNEELYLLMKYYQDDQHTFHETILFPFHQKTRKEFENVFRKEMPELSDLKGKCLIALYLLSKDVLPIDVLSRFVIGGLNKQLSTIVGGKNLGLAYLNSEGYKIPFTIAIPTYLLESGSYKDYLETLEKRNYSVRSSATVEDGTNHSFAGMFTSVLDVPNKDLEKAIEEVKKSAYSDRVISYSNHFNTQKPRMSVVIQTFKEPTISGVWIGNNIDEGYLEWTHGNGEKLVSGKVKPSSEKWPTNKEDVIKVKDTKVGEECLKLQKKFNAPADLEWCILGDQLLWLQYRPVTTKIVNKEESTDDAYEGIAASSGIVCGKPIYLEGTKEKENFQSGSILLTDYTDPDWVPIMVNSKAIITAEGGFLSHTAIIARELGIPCVTGLGYDAIADLEKYPLIEVNGNSGKVKKSS